MKTALAALAALLLAGAADCAESKTVTRDGRTVEFVECPKCEMRARFAADAKSATINVSRLRDGNPDKHRYSRLRTMMLERVFKVMETAAAAAEQPFWGEGLVRTWRTRGLPAYVVQREDRFVVLVKDVGEPGGKVREVALYNMSDAAREFHVTFASLDLGGKVLVLDLTERAIPEDFASEIAVRVPPKSAKIYRLSAESRVERSLFSVASASVREPGQIVWKDVTIVNGGRRTVEFTCDVKEDTAFFVTIGPSKPAHVSVRALEGMASLAIGEVLVTKGVHDIRAYAPEGEALPTIKEVRMYR